jgi:hypothetical protein
MAKRLYESGPLTGQQQELLNLLDQEQQQSAAINAPAPQPAAPIGSGAAVGQAIGRIGDATAGDPVGDAINIYNRQRWLSDLKDRISKAREGGV